MIPTSLTYMYRLSLCMPVMVLYLPGFELFTVSRVPEFLSWLFQVPFEQLGVRLKRMFSLPRHCW